MRSEDRRVVSLPRIGRTRIVVTEYKRLVVTYSAGDDTVYLLCPPGEDLGTILGAARLVLHDESYEELACYLGASPLERAG